MIWLVALLLKSVNLIQTLKKGPSIETVLNRESKRKTAAIVCIHEGVRYFGSDAVSFVRFFIFNLDKCQNSKGSLG